MAKGRKPHPDDWKFKLGNPGKRTIPAQVESPGIGDAEMDDPMAMELLGDDKSLQIWNSLVPQLDAMGILKKYERGGLIRYCALLAEWYENRMELVKQGMTYENPVYDKDGKEVGKLIKLNPRHRARIDHERLLIKYEQELCITPLTRQNMLNAMFGAGKGADPNAKGKAMTDNPTGKMPGLENDDDNIFGYGNTKH